MYNALDVARWLIRFTGEQGDVMTNMRLQKLLYYGQAWALALDREPLFQDDFQAWIKGPVLPCVYFAYAEHGFAPLPVPDDAPALSAEVETHLEEMFAEYGRYSAYDLSRMTHSEAPWLDARGDIPEDEPSDAVISKEAMAAYYAEQAA